MLQFTMLNLFFAAVVQDLSPEVADRFACIRQSFRIFAPSDSDAFAAVLRLLAALLLRPFELALSLTFSVCNVQSVSSAVRQTLCPLASIFAAYISTQLVTIS
jgi:hypothetical protein